MCVPDITGRQHTCGLRRLSCVIITRPGSMYEAPHGFVAQVVIFKRHATCWNAQTRSLKRDLAAAHFSSTLGVEACHDQPAGGLRAAGSS